MKEKPLKYPEYWHNIQNKFLDCWQFDLISWPSSFRSMKVSLKSVFFHENEIPS